ncbi:hypothetical protein QUA00_25335 [Microcoleus sp. T2B6]|uniref:hypothetical protein n=1 Tax=Microcoleus sp. T2B6 TaxID=3055424 RepID=UPI002FD31C25
MKLNLAIPGLLIALLVACNDTTTTVAPTVSPSAAANPTSKPVVSEPTPTATPTPVVSEPTPTATPTPVAPEPTPTPTNSSNPFDSDSFPKAGCGDRMPTDKKTDTIKLYPVFVDYSDSNLKTIKANYCGDALKITTKDKGKYVIQVASFTDEKRVNQFKEFLARKLGNSSVEVGEATIIGVKPIQKSPKNDAKAAQPTGEQQSQDKKADDVVGNDNSPYAIGKAAKLTTQEVEKLVSLEKTDLVLKDKLKMEYLKLKAIVPTYIPPGFKVKKLYAWKDSNNSYYRIEYSNSSDSRFEIASACCFCGDEPLGYKEIEVNSKKLGKIIVAYTYFDNDINQSHLVCATGILYNKNTNREYYFSTETVNITEAIKIVESLQYLNP